MYFLGNYTSENETEWNGKGSLRSYMTNLSPAVD